MKNLIYSTLLVVHLTTAQPDVAILIKGMANPTNIYGTKKWLAQVPGLTITSIDICAGIAWASITDSTKFSVGDLENALQKAGTPLERIQY